MNKTNLIENNFLEKGDFFPFITIGNRSIHNIVDNRYILIFNTKQKINTSKLSNKYNILIKQEHENVFNIIPEANENIYVLLLSPNRRIKEIFINPDFDMLLNLNLNNYKEHYNFPFIMIENALGDELLKEIIECYKIKKEKNNVIEHKTSTKDRQHVFGDNELQKKIDIKLSKSVLPELKKIFYFTPTHRENYKICSYDSITSGRFHSHRDTVHPYQYRKYAMSLLLNDDYVGGELYLSEYDMKIKPKANTAIIFPGISSHQVLKVEKGSRMAMITFFTDNDVRKRDKMKANFYKDKNVEFTKIYPENKKLV